MGKKGKKLVLKKMKNIALGEQIVTDGMPRSTGRVKRKEPEDEDDKLVDEKLTKKILAGAKQQRRELDEEEFGGSRKSSINFADDGDEDDVADAELESEPKEDEDGSRFMDEYKISKEDEFAINMFMRKKPDQPLVASRPINLGEWIAEKIRQKEMEINDHLSEVESVKIQKLDPKIEGLYKGVAQVMSRYRSGRVPKPFKIIPSLTNWEQILMVTNPDQWTAAAVFAGTRIFSSNSSEKMAQRFYNLLLLPRVRDDIETFKKLNFHLYQSLRKALYKPGAFFKGIILPLIEGGDCSLREAVIISSVIAKHSVPMLHSAAAILKIAEMEYSGSSSVFLHVLLNKKYALPYRVIDGVVYHMIRFEHDRRTLPVLWHQVLLVFVQNYAQDLGHEQRDALLSLIRVQSHWQITPIIRRILQTTKPRDIEEGDFTPQEIDE